MPNNDPSLLQGLTLKSLKHHVALQPLFVIMGAGIIFVGAYIGRLVNCTSIYLTKTVTLDAIYCRLASKTTDVNWSKQKDTTDVHAYYENRQFKWFNPRGVDYSTISDKRGAPKLD